MKLPFQGKKLVNPGVFFIEKNACHLSQFPAAHNSPLPFFIRVPLLRSKKKRVYINFNLILLGERFKIQFLPIF